MADALLMFCIISIWGAVFQSILIMVGAVRFIFRQSRKEWTIPDADQMAHFPKVTVLVPAHNEELVIAATAEHILRLNYPKDKVQLIVIADNCSDGTAGRLKALNSKAAYRDRDFMVFERSGTGGKSGALNDALAFAKHEWICIFDADAAPERNALYFLIEKAMEDPKTYGAVFGRNKARNRGQNFLSKCINLELVTAQRIYHTGLWELFKLGTIPGTNFIVKTDLILEIGGWDTEAITEDTAISFEIMTRGQLIALAPQAEAYQQEPEQLSVYLKQRERWAKGNFSVVMENIHHLFDRSSWRIKLHVLYYAASYFWFLLSIIVSDIIIGVNLVYWMIALFKPDVVSPFQFADDVYVYLMVAWGLMYYLFVLQINLALATDVGQSSIQNFILSCLSYFTYAQLFLLISLRALYSFVVDKVTGRKAKWYKTQRFG
ncbi:glycosyltransferase family 2 protein [Paenibacillus glucanolyticus]|uniref:glycosyltransferase family 2 protein n=1 Tax=Paenibacillus TaxID=44249 RepID=UPI0003E1B8FF|nr:MULTISPECIES: glycosyltransferase [Paenibacillus]ANA80090.1 glycosyl transferase [Paenibacillus glucanolyticus]AVV55885.1 glycosyltransferase family 2 protein [Paenibacillus glucanolyticus]ETT38482.1 family 2 glycosyl transferase [Paenibacillus sp. FSL R5-808]MPY19310.1 glycosyltransferase family 2 protein [Paenibacillus glucanolyticus]OMF79326.1 glycosyl transferase [Paenibacillus glucanolyticus]